MDMNAARIAVSLVDPLDQSAAECRLQGNRFPARLNWGSALEQTGTTIHSGDEALTSRPPADDGEMTGCTAVLRVSCGRKYS
jgi:hypothetical protein